EEHEYQLTLRPDLFTNKHTQWYYFQVTNTQAGIVYRFTIVNFTKPASLYNRGMRPLFYSEKEAKAHHIGWQRIGDQIKYYRNNPGQDGRHYFSLTWTFQFPHNKDTCYFAHCYPYTYTNLQEYLSGINNDPVRSKFCKIRVLCHTLARNMVYVLTITTPLKNTDSRTRKAVILTARVHPGETNSSWIMKGFLDYILGDSRDAQLLRDTFVFKVVPMLNPDGVIVGNYRCSLAGRDLNRNYTSLLKESFPSVWYTRNMIHRVDKLIDVLGNKRGTHFSTKDLGSMGYHFCDSLLDYCDPDRTKVNTRPNEPDDYMVDYFRRQLPDQGLELHHNLKSKMKECISFQSKKSGRNWTDDEKRIYRDKRIARTQEMLQYLLPIIDSTKNMQTTQIKQLFSTRTNFQIQHQ
ncbi:PREDICTED: cytosolic carboxypeptidase 3, partial [Propithecus coquereli]|uniref:cytosolic carboxypeptidase 3 n=1 Tax=Propithecus coquereli TaxID=379532 RepID=UPI00063EE33B